MTNILTPPPFPLFGTYVLYGVMLVASYTFAVALGAGASGRPRALAAARSGAFGTCALVLVAVLCLAYAFVTHDFRLRYVAHYSDRSMSPVYLFTALWGGQDGSLLWWLFLLSLYIAVCVKWLGRKYLELQPYVIATLMAVVLFFCVLMAFAANPFATSIAGAKPDGEGLNPLLQNFYMIIHPPSLYVGFVGCSVPFAFGVAALVTGRLDQEWIVASRKFTLFAWLFLAIGNTLGMLWAYEELGWGGYWAWDPVENAAFMPFLVATAFVHSVMIQERRGLFKVWNVFLVCFTFFMTIFGTFLTRSGMIASVHSFAQSSIGSYFAWFLLGLVIVVATLIFYRWPELRGLPPRRELRKAAVIAGWVTIVALGPGLYAIAKLDVPIAVKTLLWAFCGAGGTYCAIELVYRRMTRHIAVRREPLEIESVFSREFTFMLNNWILLGIMLFILVATTFPLMSEAFWNEKVTVGPPFYGAWLPPLGLLMYSLMGVGTLFGWKKTSPDSLRRAFRAPLIATAVVAVLHLTLGRRLGYPAIVWGEPIYGGAVGSGLRVVNAALPMVGIAASAFNAAVIVQEFVMLFRARQKTGASKTPTFLYWLGFLPGFFHAVVSLPAQSRRRYGGYIVHLGIVVMFVGFTGKSWNVDKETSMVPGQTFQIDNYSLEYVGPRMEVDQSKRMIFADIKVTKNGKPMGTSSPAKFIYKKAAETPTTEVSMLHTIADDLYLVVGSVSPQTKNATLQVHVNALVSWIWFGAIVLIFGSIVCMWPELVPEESRAWAFARAGAGVTASVMLGFLLAMTPAYAHAQTSSSLHAGTVQIDNPREKALFSALRCMCGDCARDILATCACTPASNTRAELRAKIAAGMSNEDIIAEYARDNGTESLSVPPDSGALRAIYMGPLAILAAGGIGLAVAINKWRKPAVRSGAPGRPAAGATKETREGGAKDDYDSRLDEELRDLE